jgi:hypothetical protein
MSDIVERLQRLDGNMPWNDQLAVFEDASEEIRNLRAGRDYDASTVVFLQKEIGEAADEITRLTARVAALEGALRDLVRLVDEDQEEDVPPYLADQVLDKARAALTQKGGE